MVSPHHIQFDDFHNVERLPTHIGMTAEGQINQTPPRNRTNLDTEVMNKNCITHTKIRKQFNPTLITTERKQTNGYNIENSTTSTEYVPKVNEQ